MAAAEGALLAIGRVARAHGIRGRVLVAPYDEESQALGSVKTLWAGEKQFEVARAERANLGWLVALRGVDDRDAADALRGLEVKVLRSDLPALEDGEMYAIDLIGFSVVDGEGKERGVVEDLEEAGAQDLLRLEGGRLVPLSLVKEVLSDLRRIVIEVPEGLFEL
ncbi:MAG TPA: ribosome maturation factor RimM [Myxococcales bacterium]|jgi:16S rRNA processing protein RimM